VVVGIGGSKGTGRMFFARRGKSRRAGAERLFIGKGMCDPVGEFVRVNDTRVGSYYLAASVLFRRILLLLLAKSRGLGYMG